MTSSALDYIDASVACLVAGIEDAITGAVGSVETDVTAFEKLHAACVAAGAHDVPSVC
jgi:hypothetical protein